MGIETQLDDLVTVKTFASRYPDVGTEAAIRWQIHSSANNGLQESGAIVKNGKKILIDVPQYLQWILRGRVTYGET